MSVSETPQSGWASLPPLHEHEAGSLLALASPGMAEPVPAFLPFTAELSTNTPTQVNSALPDWTHAFSPGWMPPSTAPSTARLPPRSQSMEIGRPVSHSSAGASGSEVGGRFKRAGSLQESSGRPRKRSTISPMTPFSSSSLQLQGGVGVGGVLGSPTTSVLEGLPLHISPQQLRHKDLPSADVGEQATPFSNVQSLDSHMATGDVPTLAPTAGPCPTSVPPHPHPPLPPTPSAQTASTTGVSPSKKGAATSKKKSRGLQLPHPDLSNDDRVKRMLGYEGRYSTKVVTHLTPDGDELLSILNISAPGWKTERADSEILGGLLRPSPPTLILLASNRYNHIRATIAAVPPFLQSVSLGICRAGDETKIVCNVNDTVFERYHQLDDGKPGEWEWRPMEGNLPSPSGEITIRGPRDVSSARWLC